MNRCSNNVLWNIYICISSGKLLQKYEYAKTFLETLIKTEYMVKQGICFITKHISSYSPADHNNKAKKAPLRIHSMQLFNIYSVMYIQNW